MGYTIDESRSTMRGCRALPSIFLSAFIMMAATMTVAWPQSAVAPPPAVQEPPPAQPTPPPSVSPAPSPAVTPAPTNPGLVEEIGKLLKDSAAGVTSTLQGSRDTILDLNTRAKDAATDSLSRISPQTIASGHAVCPVAANGAPDCKLASDALCKQKGYKEGKSLDIVSAEKCSANTYLSGRTGAPGECKTENFVTRAVCQ